MHEFGVSLRLWMIVFTFLWLSKVYGNILEVWNQIWKVLGCG